MAKTKAQNRSEKMVTKVTKAPHVDDWKQVVGFVDELNRLKAKRHKVLEDKKYADDRWEDEEWSSDKDKGDLAIERLELADEAKTLRKRIDATNDELCKKIASICGGTLWSPPEAEDDEAEVKDLEGQGTLAGVGA